MTKIDSKVTASLIAEKAAASEDTVLFLYGEWATLGANSEAVAKEERDAFDALADAIEAKIWATPSETSAGIACKARMVERWAKSHEHLEDLDWREKVAVWLRIDAERLACLPAGE